MSRFAIVDLETNGRANRITEIAIIVYENGEIINSYESLVNPGGSIPPFITSLTGITQEMLVGQPRFDEIASEVKSTLEGCVFVAHNVSFDYNILKAEFENIGQSFKYPKLCTVRMSRKIIPGFRSYSLGKLCGELGITNKSRHRAYGDALATVELFQILENKPSFQEVIATALHQRSKEATIPSHLAREEFEKLPSLAGIYKFYNLQQQLIYVGKAKNIKQRVLSHFYNKSLQKVSMIREIAHIDFELAGTELVALLMEDAVIKRQFPKYNRASKQRINGLALVTYDDRKGIKHLGLQNIKDAVNPLKYFFNPVEARQYIEMLLDEFQLCAKFCHLIENVQNCDDSIFYTCLGICKGEEEVAAYNQRVDKAIEKVINDLPSGVIKQKGRHQEEDAFIRIIQGKYCGYGFIDKNLSLHPEEIDDFMISEKDNLNVQKILLKYFHLIQPIH